MNWIDELIDEYLRWFKSKTLITTDSISEWTAIRTPFVGLFNDYIEIYAQKKGDHIILSDNGETINNLELSGVKLTKGVKKDTRDRILNNYGIKRNDDDELIVEGTVKDFPQKKHNLVTAIIEFGDLYLLSKEKVETFFLSDVREYLESHGIIYTPDFISKGLTGLEFAFDFQIALKKKEVVIKSFPSLKQSNILNFLFTWEDIRPVREEATKKEVKAVAIINDTEGVKREFLDALQSHKADYILWSARDSKENLDKLAA
jgi:hypothetical protein